MDYAKLGLKVGIEIHQRLDTKQKLFCPCSPRMAGGEGPQITRKLKAVAGELGNIDPAALYELARGREFVYRTYGSCLVEQDEEPPHELNKEALYIALQMARLLKADVPEEIHVMRKTVLDGSNTSGFQRTAIVGLNGTLTTTEGEVKVPTIALEEEAAQILSREGGRAEYGLDRLGIPLIETATAVISSPRQAKEAALKLGSLLRSLRVQRGLGTIRQDVNISISGGARVEIKGFQDIDGLEKLIELEAERQLSLMEIKKELEKRKPRVGEVSDVTDTFSETKNKKVRSLIGEGKKAWGMRLGGFSGLLKRKISGERTLGKELAGYAKAYGSGIIHSDEDIGKYELAREFEKLSKLLEASGNDLLLVSVGDRKAIEAVRERALMASEGVPEETREANEDYTTSYSRPLPGKSRLYPETDIPPIAPPKDIRTPETLEEKKAKMMKTGLNNQLADEILRSPFLALFEELPWKNPVRTATQLTSTMKELRRDGKNVDNIKEEDLRELLAEMDKTGMPKEKVYEILVGFTEGKEMQRTESIDIQEVRNVIAEEMRNNKDLVEKEGERAFQKLMGPIMEKLRGKASGAVIAEELRKRLKR